MKKIRVGLVGITGYAGMELARLLANHPVMSLCMACSRAEAGKRLGDYYPFLEKMPGADVAISVFEPEEAAKSCDLVFLAVPAGTAMNMAGALLAFDVKVVDFSADFRLHDARIYEEWYGKEHLSANLLARAVYGLPEIHADRIAGADLVANPGCYPSSVILGLCAALKNNLIAPDDIVVDAKSGASGAGRKPALASLYCEVSDNFRAYGLPRHRHTPEIEQELSEICGQDVLISFNTHLLPMNRGILSTIYTRLRDPSMDPEEIRQIFRQTWEGSAWVRVLPEGLLPETRFVRGSMFCDIGMALDRRTGRLIILAAIDNLCRGAAGQALANANLMCGLRPDLGLEHLAPLF